MGHNYLGDNSYHMDWALVTSGKSGGWGKRRIFIFNYLKGRNLHHLTITVVMRGCIQINVGAVTWCHGDNVSLSQCHWVKHLP